VPSSCRIWRGLRTRDARRTRGTGLDAYRTAITDLNDGRPAGELGAVLGDLRAGVTVPAGALSALNRAAASADSACGTLRF
jgi:hypothetical protein